MKVFPATVMVADRETPAIAGDTVYLTVPGPLPLFLDAKVIQEALDDAAQLQPAIVETTTVPVPPDALNDRLVGHITKEHFGAAALSDVQTTLPE